MNKWEGNETNRILINVIFLVKLGGPFRKYSWPQFYYDCAWLSTANKKMNWDGLDQFINKNEENAFKTYANNRGTLVTKFMGQFYDNNLSIR